MEYEENLAMLGIHIDPPANVLYSIETKCYQCDLLIEQKSVIGGQTGQKIESPKQCKYHLCSSCIRNYCKTQVFRDKQLLAGINNEDEDPQPCDCADCKKEGLY